MTDPAKVRRHAERVKELVASVVRTQVKDPRLGMITITDARITADATSSFTRSACRRTFAGSVISNTSAAKTI